MTTALSDLFEWVSDLFNILFLSITSKKFYTDNFQYYSGYGVKYLLTVSMLCALFVSIVLLSTADTLREYFVDGKVSERVVVLDQVISQFPTLQYDGKNISLTDAMPVTISNSSNKAAVLIDPSNKIPMHKRSKVPVYMGDNKITFNLISANDEIIKTIEVSYQSILGDQSIVINQNIIRSFLSDVFNNASTIIIFVIFPALSVLLFCNVVLRESISIFILVILFYFYKSQIYLKNCIRIALFSSGVVLLMQIMTSILLPGMLQFIWVAELWVNFLVVVGLFPVLFNTNKN